MDGEEKSKELCETTPGRTKTGKKAGKRDHAARRASMRERSQERLRKSAVPADVSEVPEELTARSPEEEGTEAAAAAENLPEPVSVPEKAEAAEQPGKAKAAEQPGETEEAPAEIPKESAEEAEPEKDAPSEPEIDEEAPEGAKKPRRKKWTAALLVTGIILLALIVTGVLAAFGVFRYFYNQSNYVAEGETYIPTAASTEPTTTEEVKEGVNYSLIGTTESTTETTTEETETVHSVNRTGVYNVLLIGIDVGSGNGNSDSMILCSINYDLHKIFLTTIMRDLEAVIPEYGPRKVNSACAIGGPTLLMDTLEQTFGFEIDNFAMIDYEGMKAVVDALGGVDLHITVEEAAFMKFEIPEDQMVHLDGRLALRHARDRSSGGSDFGRTQRQRNVLMAIVKKARRGDIGDIVEAAKAILPYITHNMKPGEIAEILWELPVLIDWEFVQQRLPYDGLFSYSNENLVMDIPAAMERWHAVVYDGAVFEDTILETEEESEEESTEESAAPADEEEESGKSEEPSSEETETEKSTTSAETTEVLEFLPPDLIKMPDGELYHISLDDAHYIPDYPPEFKFVKFVPPGKTVRSADELGDFDATGSVAQGYEIASSGSDWYVGTNRRFFKLEKYSGR